MTPLARQLKENFGVDYPVDSGSGDRDHPLVITARRNYAAIEQEIAKFLLDRMALDYELQSQRPYKIGDSVVDELIYSTKEHGESAWTGSHHLFFDITIGYYMIHSKFEEDHEDDEIPSEEELRRRVAEIIASTPQSKKDYDHARDELVRTSIDAQIIASRYFNRAATIVPLLVFASPLLSSISWSKALIAAFCTYLVIVATKRTYLFAANRRLTAKSVNLSNQYYSKRYK